MRPSTTLMIAAIVWMGSMLGAGSGVSECTAAPQSVAGKWLGIIKAPGQELRIAFEISQTREGGYTAVLHSIDQGAMNIPMSTVVLNGDSLRLELKTGGNADYTIRELPGLNHLFQTCNTGAFSEYVKIEETMSPLALQAVSDWIVAKTGVPKGDMR